jgi:hypothetical protein
MGEARGKDDGRRQILLGLPAWLAADMSLHEHMSQVIAHVLPPAFLLGALAGFINLLTGRLNRIIDRIRRINAIAAEDTAHAYLKVDLPRLQRRARLVNSSIYFAVGAAICTTLLLIVAFVFAFFGQRHEVAVGLVFVVALTLMCASLVTLAREVRIALSDLDHHP